MVFFLKAGFAAKQGIAGAAAVADQIAGIHEVAAALALPELMQVYFLGQISGQKWSPLSDFYCTDKSKTLFEGFGDKSYKAFGRKTKEPSCLWKFYHRKTWGK